MDRHYICFASFTKIIKAKRLQETIPVSLRHLFNGKPTTYGLDTNNKATVEELQGKR